MYMDVIFAVINSRDPLVVLDLIPLTLSPLRNDVLLLNFPQYTGRIRRFHPSELAAMFGFPSSFQVPCLHAITSQSTLIPSPINTIPYQHTNNIVSSTRTHLFTLHPSFQRYQWPIDMTLERQFACIGNSGGSWVTAP